MDAFLNLTPRRVRNTWHARPSHPSFAPLHELSPDQKRTECASVLAGWATLESTQAAIAESDSIPPRIHSSVALVELDSTVIDGAGRVGCRVSCGVPLFSCGRGPNMIIAIPTSVIAAPTRSQRPGRTPSITHSQSTARGTLRAGKQTTANANSGLPPIA